MATSAHHYDVRWCKVGEIIIMYHTSISMNTSVTYDERSVFGSHGAYAVWTGTAPRSYSISANLVAANKAEVEFNMAQVQSAYNWTQQNPPKCVGLDAPGKIFNTSVRIESFDASIPESTHLDTTMGYGQAPIQIDFSLGLKECKPI